MLEREIDEHCSIEKQPAGLFSWKSTTRSQLTQSFELVLILQIRRKSARSSGGSNGCLQSLYSCGLSPPFRLAGSRLRSGGGQQSPVVDHVLRWKGTAVPHQVDSTLESAFGSPLSHFIWHGEVASRICFETSLQRLCTHFQRDRVVAAAVQKAARIKLRKTDRTRVHVGLWV